MTSGPPQPIWRVLVGTLADDSGSNLVEFAACCSIFFSLLFGVMYVCILMYADHYVSTAANEAARYAAVRGASWGAMSCTTPSSVSCAATASNVSTFVQAAMPPGLDSTQLNVTTTWPGVTPAGAACDTADGLNGPNCAVQVKVTYQFGFPVPFIPQKSIPLSATSRLSIVD